MEMLLDILNNGKSIYLYIHGKHLQIDACTCKANVALETALTNGIPIKGAIAKGIMTADFNKSIYVGVPLIDAYNLQKEFCCME